MRGDSRQHSEQDEAARVLGVSTRCGRCGGPSSPPWKPAARVPWPVAGDKFASPDGAIMQLPLLFPRRRGPHPSRKLALTSRTRPRALIPPSTGRHRRPPARAQARRLGSTSRLQSRV